MNTTLWNALGIASKDKAIRLTCLGMRFNPKSALVMVEVVDRTSGKLLYSFGVQSLLGPEGNKQTQLKIALDAECTVNAEGVAQLLQDAQDVERDRKMNEHENKHKHEE